MKPPVRYKNGDYILTIGKDEYGRVWSKIEKNNKVIQSDIYIKIPREAELRLHGWVKIEQSPNLP